MQSFGVRRTLASALPLLSFSAPQSFDARALAARRDLVCAVLTFGDRAAPVVFGWIMPGHQLGAATAAFLGGVMRTQLGSYFEAIMIAGATALVASVLSLWIGGHTIDRELKSAPAT
jgi:hypothetical protein